MNIEGVLTSIDLKNIELRALWEAKRNSGTIYPDLRPREDQGRYRWRQYQAECWIKEQVRMRARDRHRPSKVVWYNFRKDQ